MTTIPMGHCPNCGSSNTAVELWPATGNSDSCRFSACYSCRFVANPRVTDFTLEDIKRIVNEVLDEREARGK